MGGKFLKGKSLPFDRALDVSSKIKKIYSDIKLTEVGTLRRKDKKICSDIDFLISSSDLKKVKKERIFNNFSYSPFGFHSIYNDIQVDFFIHSAKNYSTSLLRWTGTYQFNKVLWEICLSKNILINHKCIFINNKKINPSSEKEIFDIIGLEYIQPEERGYFAKEYMEKKKR